MLLHYVTSLRGIFYFFRGTELRPSHLRVGVYVGNAWYMCFANSSLSLPMPRLLLRWGPKHFETLSLLSDRVSIIFVSSPITGSVIISIVNAFNSVDLFLGANWVFLLHNSRILTLLSRPHTRSNVSMSLRSKSSNHHPMSQPFVTKCLGRIARAHHLKFGTQSAERHPEVWVEKWSRGMSQIRVIQTAQSRRLIGMKLSESAWNMS